MCRFRAISKSVYALLSCLALPALASAQFDLQSSGTDARLRGLCVVNPQTAWTSGTNGTVLLTTDGGKRWINRSVAQTDDSDLRDIEAFDATTAWALSIGEGTKSRILKTVDGGRTWKVQYINQDPRGFLDAIAFWDRDHGIALGDPVDGRYTILTTDDGGSHWSKIAPEGMPRALEGEGAFAASGTCLVIEGSMNAWFCTGSAKLGRVFRSSDRGRTWTVAETPIKASSASAGIFSIAFRDAQIGVAIGGDYKRPEISTDVVATTADGGRSWKAPVGQVPGGYRSAIAYVGKQVLVAVGPAGADLSEDGGQTWKPFGKRGFHAVRFSEGAGWAVGENGQIGRVELQAKSK